MRRISTVAFLLACAVGMSRAHRACTSYNGWFYDLSSDASITTLDRYQGTTFVNRQTYAPFNLPAPGTSVWDEGVAFAATMQTRNSWLNSEQTSAASWVVNNGNTVWRWSTTVNGAPVQFTFTTEACSPAPPSPPTAAPTAAPTAGPTSPPATGAPSPALVGFHACISHNGWFYDLKGDATFTQLDRYQGTTFRDRNNYAPFHLPAAGTTAWDEGVAFAATMQTRNVWLTSAQTTAATWAQGAAGDTMVFSINGAQYVFTTSNCV